ncbi:ribonuclease HI family protein [Tuberibacillus calidus]|uniref:ribonuclease HI family protein n=1 Tax=Tuberibacillus calidus TaxID=340097 RepID=UPI0003FA2AFE|nr:ribonuclease HI family protein [Tuberibacillus calidus]
MIEVYIDGASAGCGGVSGIGIVLKLSDGTVEEHAISVEAKNNHEAEFIAAIQALKLCLAKKLSSVSLRTDSQIVDRALNRHYVKNSLFQPYLEQFKQLETQFDLLFVKWIPSAQNKKADQLAKTAIHRRKEGKTYE